MGLNGLGDWNGALNVKLVRTTMLIFVALVWTITFMAEKMKLLAGFSLYCRKENFFHVYPGLRYHGRLKYLSVYSIS